MRILITGAGGNVSRGLSEPLLEAGHSLVVTDITRPGWLDEHPEVDFHQFDIQVGFGLERAADGCDVIVHTAAWHGIHTRHRTDVDFWRLNADGTMWVTQAAVAVGARVLFLSSQAWHTRYDKYGFTKRVGEELLAYQHRQSGLAYVALRPNSFTPWTTGGWAQEYGVGLLKNRVDRRDVLQAALRSINYLGRSADAELVVDAVRANVLTADDISDWSHEPVATAERIFPGARELIERHGLEIPAMPILEGTSGWTEIGYKPAYHFGTFVDEAGAMSQADIRRMACPY